MSLTAKDKGGVLAIAAQVQSFFRPNLRRRLIRSPCFLGAKDLVTGPSLHRFRQSCPSPWAVRPFQLEV